MDITRWSTLKSDGLYSFAAKNGEVLYNQQKTRPGADCGSDHELLIAKFRLKLKKVEKTLDDSGMTKIKYLTIIQWKQQIDSRD